MPKKYKSGDGFYLGQWIIRQCGDYVEGELSPERTARLNSIGMAWLAPHDALWEQGFNNAKVYYSDNGNLNVPRGYRSDNGYNLGAWISNRRYDYIKGRLSSEKVKRLNSIGMQWDKREYNREKRKNA